nr:MAG TPA: hypothetical protein [Caudoviricetes sp.]
MRYFPDGSSVIFAINPPFYIEIKLLRICINAKRIGVKK